MTLYYGNGGGNGSGFSARLLIGAVIAIIGIISYFTHTSVNPTTGEKQHVSMSPDQEMAMGLQAAPEMAAQMGGEMPDSDPRSIEVQKIGAQIVAHSDASRSPYQYKYHLLSDTKTINAFALPGGQVFITRGLYDKLADEAELAGVLGHETGHVVERHSAQQIEKGRLGQMLVTAVGVASSNSRNGYSEAAVASMVNQMVQLRNSRADESQADQRGLQFMTEVGYDPNGMIDVMKILQKEVGNGNGPEFLQTHPDPGNRIGAIQDWLKANPNLAPNLTRGAALPH